MARLVTDRTGEVFGALKIINELGDNKVSKLWLFRHSSKN